VADTFPLFFGHLYLEKLLKALVVQRTGRHASPTHQLVSLAKAAGLDLDATRQGQLDEVTGFNVATRYPDYRFAFKKACTKEFCAVKTALIDELAQWLKSAMKP
jgi:HEPN domain-containing protein